MPIVPAGFIVPSKVAASAIPEGWVRETALDGLFPKGAAAGADPGTPGGADTHTHASPAHSHTVSSHQHVGGTLNEGAQPYGGQSGGTSFAANGHQHTAGTSGAASATLADLAAPWGESPNTPPAHDVIWLRSLGTAEGIPAEGWALWDDETPPSGWSAPAGPQGRYPKGAAAGGDAGGQTGGSSSHSHAASAHQHIFGAHSHGSANSSVADSATGIAEDAGAVSSAVVSQAHFHIVSYQQAPSTASSGSATSASTGSTTPEIPYITVGLVENDTGDEDFPIGIIGAWLNLLSAVPLSLSVCDGSNGTLDMRGRYPKLATTSAGAFVGIGDTGGTATHDHTDPAAHTHSASHQHSMYPVSVAVEVATVVDVTVATHGVTHLHNHVVGGSAGSSGSAGGTSGSGTQTVDAGSHEPPHRTVIWVKYTGAIDVDVTAPVADAELSAPAFTAEWDLVGSGGTQATKRVRIYASDQSTLVYDSGLIADTSESYNVPSGIGLRTGRTYYLRVSVVDTEGVPGESPLVRFTTGWTPPAVLSGLTLTPVGSADGRLPGIRADWTAYAESNPFVRYTVYRRQLRTLLDEHETLAMQVEDDGRVLLPTADVLNGVQGAIAFRVTTPATGSGTPTYFDWQDDSTHRFRLLYDVSAGEWQFWRLTDAGTTTLSVTRALAAETLTIVAAWDASTLYLSFNGAAYTSAASVAGEELTVDLADIGSRQGFDDAGAEFHWMLTFAAVPDAAALAVIHALGDDPPYIAALEDIAGARPVALWDAEEPTGSKVAPDDWTDIVTIDDVARTYYVDYRPESTQSYEYGVTVVANVFGEEIESDRQEPAPHESVTWRGIALHEPDDPTRFLILHGRELQVEPEQDKAYVQARGRRQRTAQYGERRDRKIALTPIPHLITEPREWQQLEQFLARQQDEGRTYLIRPGHRPEGWYVQLDDLSRRDVLVLGQSDVVFQQVHYDESVSS